MCSIGRVSWSDGFMGLLSMALTEKLCVERKRVGMYRIRVSIHAQICLRNIGLQCCQIW